MRKRKEKSYLYFNIYIKYICPDKATPENTGEVYHRARKLEAGRMQPSLTQAVWTSEMHRIALVLEPTLLKPSLTDNVGKQHIYHKVAGLSEVEPRAQCVLEPDHTV